MKIGFISRFNPQDRKASSGTTFQMWQSLKKKGYEMEWIQVHEGLIYKFFRCVFAILNKVSNRKTKIEYTNIGSILEAKSLSKRKIIGCDILIGAFCSGAISRLKTNTPIIYFSDATFNLLNGYYFNNLSYLSIKAGNVIEQRALTNATRIVVSSDWAKKSVINDYGISEKKVDVIEFGANIDNVNINCKSDNCLIKPNESLRLIFIGVDWERKGGEIAVETLNWLNSNGVKAELHVIGIKQLPEAHAKNKNIINHGFLNKNIPLEYTRLTEIIAIGDLFIFPTIRECSAIVLCEASAYGLPIFSHATGGTSNYVVDGINGFLLKLGSTGADFGEKIKDCINDNSLVSMRQSARRLFESRLNWGIWSEKVNKIIEETIQRIPS